MRRPFHIPIIIPTSWNITILLSMIPINIIHIPTSSRVRRRRITHLKIHIPQLILNVPQIARVIRSTVRHLRLLHPSVRSPPEIRLPRFHNERFRLLPDPELIHEAAFIVFGFKNLLQSSKNGIVHRVESVIRVLYFFIYHVREVEFKEMDSFRVSFGAIETNPVVYVVEVFFGGRVNVCGHEGDLRIFFFFNFNCCLRLFYVLFYFIWFD